MELDLYADDLEQDFSQNKVRNRRKSGIGHKHQAVALRYLQNISHLPLLISLTLCPHTGLRVCRWRWRS